MARNQTFIDGAKHFTDEVFNRMGQLKESLGDRIDDGSHFVRETARSVNQAADRTGDQVGTAVTKYGKELGNVIRKHPFAAAATTFGIGFIAVKLFRR